ncbi:MAG: methyltransferase domain-containing protein [Candidatus Nanoarchaeia archaeon]|nr:methyltransferase domain-containing protein [Candidatus Nanoarchaeia archaeon]
MSLLKEKLKGKLSKKDFDKLPSSFDVIGDIAIVEIRNLKGKDKLIADAILKNVNNVKVVAKKSGIHTGRYRTQKLKIIGGEKRKETVHVESGVRMKLDVEKCYFSPRLSEERLRISRLVKKNEKILVMFSGISVYPLVISRNSKAKEIYGVEINPSAHKYGLENVCMNKARNVHLIKGNVTTTLPKLKEKFDRIIMAYPKFAHKYLNLAKKYLKKGGVIHFYTFSHEDDFTKLKKKYNVKRLFKCGAYAPRVYRVCLDLKF